MSTQNLIERSFEVFARAQQRNGFGTDEVSFVGGFMACYGVLTGRVPLPGLPDDTPVQARFDAIQRELEKMRNSAIGAYQDNQRNGG